MRLWSSGFWAVSCLVCTTSASVTVYGQIPLAQQTTAVASAGGPAPSLLPAYNELILNPPPVPVDPVPAKAFTLNLQQSATAMPGLSIAHRGDFFGFSIEMSVINQLREWSFLFVDGIES